LDKQWARGFNSKDASLDLPALQRVSPGAPGSTAAGKSASLSQANRFRHPHGD